MNVAQRQEEMIYQMIKDGHLQFDASDLAEKITDAIDEYIDYDRLSVQVGQSNVKGEIASVIEACLSFHKCGEDAEKEIRDLAAARSMGKPSVFKQ